MFMIASFYFLQGRPRPHAKWLIIRTQALDSP
jgi:hypothetical protein